MSDQHPDRSRLRAADADRDRVAAALGHALASGQLSPEEHAERLDAVYSAKTIGELAVITHDLQPESTVAPVAVIPAPGHSPRTAVYIFSGTDRKGYWRVPGELRSVCVFGGASYDMREAEFSAPVIVVRSFCLFGGINVKVPEGVRVVNEAWAVFGGIDTPGEEPYDSGAAPPYTLVVRGFCLFGGISVERRRKKLRGR